MQNVNISKPPATATLRVVCLVFQNELGQILATRRPLHKHLGGLWEFPGGKIEPGETPVQALRREIKEELELALGILHPMHPTLFSYDYGTIELIPFFHVAKHPNICLTEHTEARWLSRKMLNTVDWMPADIPILNQLFTKENENIVNAAPI